MICIGRLDRKQLKEIIIPAYQNYRHIEYDLCNAKRTLIDFLLLNYSDPNKTFPVDPNLYKLNICGDKRFKLENNDIKDVLFTISVKSGKVYVSYK